METKRKRRNFTPEFKAKVVLEALRGESSQVSEVCRRHNLSEDQLSKMKKTIVENRSISIARSPPEEDSYHENEIIQYSYRA